MLDSYDVFLSYTWADQEGVRLIEAALRSAGLRVWRDEREVDSFASIVGSIEHGLARSKALVAYYSVVYPTRRACQFELSAAFIAAQQDGDPRNRVLVVNPENGSSHIDPVELRDELYPHAPRDEADAAAVASAIARQVAGLDGLLGDIQPRGRPSWFGTQPAGSTRFVGRVQPMWAVHSAVQGFDYAPITGATGAGAAQIRGLAGTGKTLLAEEYALRFGAAYPGGVFWLRALGSDMGDRSREERNALRHTQVRAFAQTLLPGRVTKELTPEEVEGLFRLELGKRRLPFLWIVDDFPVHASSDELRSWLAPHPLGRSLITTRSQEYTALARPVELGALPPQDGLDLLTVAREPGDEGELVAAREIVQELGGHALAVDVAGAALGTAREWTSFEAFRRLLLDQTADALDLAAEFAGELPSGHERSIAATIGASIQRLSKRGRDVAALASQLAAAPVPLELVEAALALVDRLEGPNAESRARAGADELRQQSLAEGVGESLQAFQVHPLVARAVRFRESRADRSRELRSAAIASIRTALSDVVSWDERARRVAWVIHARALGEAAEEQDVLELLSALAEFDYEQADFAAAEVEARRSYEGFGRLLGADHEQTQAAKGDLAAVLHAVGDLENARQLQTEVLETAQRLLGDDHPATLRAQANLAVTLNEAGDLAAARAHKQAVLAARLETLGEEHPDTILARSNLASVAYAEGNFNEAQRLAEQSLAIASRTLGADHPLALQAQGELSQALYAAGDLQAARAAQRALVETVRRHRGASHPDTITAEVNLAATLAELGDFEGARELEETAYAASRDALGNEHPQTLWIGNNLAMTLLELSKYDSALALQRDILSATASLLGDEHPDTLRAATNLGELTERAGRVEEAREMKARAYALACVALGERHPDTLRIRLSFANTLYTLEELSEAGEHYEAAARSLRESLGAQHPETLRALGNLARVLDRQRATAEAVAIDEIVLAGRQRQLGDAHPETVTAAENLEKTRLALSELEAAPAALDEARKRWSAWACERA